MSETIEDLIFLEKELELIKKHISINIIDKRNLLATIDVLPNTTDKDVKTAQLLSYLSREEANILSNFSTQHNEFYTDLMVVDKNLPLDKQVPRNITDISRERMHDMVKLDDKFFTEAFRNDETNQPYFVHLNIRNLSEEFCKINNIKGISDPMYIANLTAYELGQGDGQSRFLALRSAASEDLDRLAERLNHAYSSNIVDPASTKELVNKHCAAAYVLSHELIKSNPSFKYIMTIKDKSDKDIIYGFYDKLSVKTHVDMLNKNGTYISYSISDNKKESIVTDETQASNIMTQLIKAGIKPEQMGNHESDLYVEVNEISEAIVKKYQFKQNVTTFQNNNDGKLNYEIPFAYQPAWDQKLSGKPTVPGLPNICYSKNETGEAILLIRGKSGYNLAPYIADVEAHNKSLGVSKAQEEAMKMGSMFGWNCLAADPKTHAHLDPPAPAPVERTPKLEQGTPNLGITHHNVGDKCEITLKNMQVMINNNKSIFTNPSDIFIAKCQDIYEAKTEGIITHTFSPGDDIVTVTFGKDTMHEQSLGMKDDYFTNLTQKQSATFPNLSQTEAKELNNFTTTLIKTYPEANPENLRKLCTIASDMTTYTIQNERGTLSNEKYNSLTDNQEKQVTAITAKVLPGAKALFSYDPTAPAIKLRMPDDTQGLITIPEFPKNKFTIPQVSNKAAEQTATKKR